MKIKNNIKRILSIVVSMMVMASLFTVTAFAAPTTTAGTIDTTKKGSLEIVKYEGNDTTKPLADVTFTYKKIADIEQILVSEEGKAKTNTIAYLVNDSAFKTAINLGKADYTIDSKDYYKAETIQNALEGTSYADMKTYATDAKNGAANMPKTNGKGESKVANLDLGLYVVVETAYPSKVTQPSNPFLVSIPSTVGAIGNDYENDTLAIATETVGTTTATTFAAKAKKWIYDITARPKNPTSTLYTDKGIVTVAGGNADGVNDDKVEEKADYNIGDTVTFRIKADVPATITKLRTYKIVDTLSTGLTYKEVTKVYAVKTNGDVVVLNAAQFEDEAKTKYTATSDYVVERDEQVVTIKFIKRGAMDDYTQVYVDLKATLNENAVIGGAGNPNSSTLKYSNSANTVNVPDTPDKPTTPENPDEPDTDLEKVPAKDPVVYTYAIDLTKYIDSVDAAHIAQGIEFELQDASKNPITVKAVTGGYVKDATATNTVLTTDANGKIVVKGLDAGTYYLKETKTKDGYNLLKDLIKVEITSTITYSEDNTNGTLIKLDDAKKYCVKNPKNPSTYIQLTWEAAQVITAGADKYLKVGTVNVYECTVDSDGKVTSVDSKISKYKQTLDWDEATYKIGDDGFVRLNVLNKKGFDLPTTGGMGTWLFTIGGLILMAGAVVLFAKSKKSVEK